MMDRPWREGYIYPAKERYIERANQIYVTLIDCITNSKGVSSIKTSLEESLGTRIDKYTKDCISGLNVSYTNVREVHLLDSTEALRGLKKSLEEEGSFRVKGFIPFNINDVDALFFLWYWPMKKNNQPAFEFRINAVADLGNNSPYKGEYGIKQLDSLAKLYSDYVDSLAGELACKKPLYNKMIYIDLKNPIITFLGLHYALSELSNLGNLKKIVNEQLQQIALRNISIEEQKLIISKFLV